MCVAGVLRSWVVLIVRVLWVAEGGGVWRSCGRVDRRVWVSEGTSDAEGVGGVWDLGRVVCVA